MVFNIDMAFAIELIALGLGGILFLKSKSEKSLFAKIISLVVIIGSVLVLTCTTINAIKFDKNKEDKMMNRRMNRMMGPPGGQGMKRFQNPQMNPNNLPQEEELEKEFEPGNTP